MITTRWQYAPPHAGISDENVFINKLCVFVSNGMLGKILRFFYGRSLLVPDSLVFVSKSQPEFKY
jgi:hypothetical protein